MTIELLHSLVYQRALLLPSRRRNAELGHALTTIMIIVVIKITVMIPKILIIDDDDR